MSDSFFRIRKPVQVLSPRHLSFSALHDIEACPAKWAMLHGAVFEGIGGNYPSRPHGSALRGQVVHYVLEQFGNALEAAGNPPPGTDEYRAIRDRINIRQLIQKKRMQLRESCAKNPRAMLSLVDKEIQVDSCINTVKQLIATCTFCTTGGTGAPYPAAAPSSSRTAGMKTGAALPPLLLEHWVQVEEPPLCGRIDFVSTHSHGDTITDFKTGKQQPEHADQLDFYSLLWAKHTHRRIIERSVVYSTGDRNDFGELSTEQVDRLESQFKQRVCSALQAISDTAKAKPGVENCGRCEVRQLCDPYWQSSQTTQLRWQFAEVCTDGQVQWKDVEFQLRDCTFSGNAMEAEFTGNEDSPTKIRCVVPTRFMESRKEEDNLLRMIDVLLTRRGPMIEIRWADNSEAYWGRVQTKNVEVATGSCGDVCNLN